MPTTRRRRAHAPQVRAYDDAMRQHLEYGDCMLGMPGGPCYCGLEGPGGVLREDLARRMWLAHRAEILAAWKRPGRPWAEGMFDAD